MVIDGRGAGRGSRQEAIFFRCRRQTAGFAFTKPAIAVFRHDIIDRITNGTRNPSQSSSQAPRAAKTLENPQHRLRLQMRPLPVPENDARKPLPIWQARFPPGYPAPWWGWRDSGGKGFTLQRGKPEPGPMIPLQGEIYKTVAEATHTIEENDAMPGFRVPA